MANKPTATKCTCPGGGRIDVTCPIHGTGTSMTSISAQRTTQTTGAKKPTKK